MRCREAEQEKLDFATCFTKALFPPLKARHTWVIMLRVTVPPELHPFPEPSGWCVLEAPGASSTLHSAWRTQQSRGAIWILQINFLEVLFPFGRGKCQKLLPEMTEIQLFWHYSRLK